MQWSMLRAVFIWRSLSSVFRIVFGWDPSKHLDRSKNYGRMTEFYKSQYILSPAAHTHAPSTNSSLGTRRTIWTKTSLRHSVIKLVAPPPKFRLSGVGIIRVTAHLCSHTMTSTNPFAMDWAPEDFGLRKARHPPGAYRELAGFPDALANTNPTTKPKKNAAPVQKPGPKPKPKQQRKSPAAPAAGPSKPASLGKTKPKAIAKSKRTVKKASQKTPLGPPQPSSPLSSPPPSPERPTSVRRKRKVAQTEFDEADASGDLGKPPPAPRGAKRPRKEKESAPDEPSKEAKAPKAPAGKKPKAKKAESSSPAASKPRKPRATPVQKASSRGSSHSVASSATLVPSESEPIYHKSRSRSSSSLPNQSSDLKPMPKVIHERDWRTDEDGVPGEGFLSSRMVVESLMRTYKACEYPVMLQLEMYWI